MKPIASFASLLLLGLLAGPPALAATTAPPAAAPAAPAAPDIGNDTTGAGPGDEDQPSGPPAEAPVPDPFLAEALKTCRDGASGDKGTFQRLQDAGWDLSVDGETQTPFYQSFSGEKDFDGVGTVDITYSLEVYPTMTEGYCSLSIDSAQRKIGIADMQKVPDLKGQYRVTNDGVASTWEDKGATPSIFIQVDQHKADLYFILDVTTLMQKPAADLPYVKPDDGGENAGDNAGGD